MHKKSMSQENQQSNNQANKYESKRARERTFAFHLTDASSARERANPRMIINAAKACATRV